MSDLEGYPAYPEAGLCVRSIGCARGLGHKGACIDGPDEPEPKLDDGSDGT